MNTPLSHTRLSMLARFIRSFILTSTTIAGSGHPTSSLSAVELMVELLFGSVFRFDPAHPEDSRNDRLIFSKGHAAPLFYALWVAAGAILSEELKTLRKFGSRLEGHPSPAFPFTEVATGSLGQGLSVGVGMALNAKYLDNLPYRTYVLLGDSEMSEGSVWEAIQLAAYYKLDNLIGVLDVNRLGQRGQTMYGHDVEAYAKRIAAFGWRAVVVNDGHSVPEILSAYERIQTVQGKPTMIIAKTVKGKGVSFIEDQEGWHGKTLSADELKRALAELGEVDQNVRGEIALPLPSPQSSPTPHQNKFGTGQAMGEEADRNPSPLTGEGGGEGGLLYPPDKPVATRKAYGNALVRIAPQFPNMVVLDAEVGNSTFAEIFKKAHPERFFEMYIAEQNMVGVALGLARRGKIPFVSTFAAFLTRAFDQIRMSQYSNSNIKFCGSHAGVSIGEDGASQMGLEDIAMFRILLNNVVLYPCDAISTGKLVEESARHFGNVYLRTTRMETPIIYGSEEQFPIGGCKILRKSEKDVVTVVGAGITLFEALAAYDELKKEGITIRVIDLYSIKPIDANTLAQAARQTRAIVTVEDHFAEGGIGEAVTSALADTGAHVHLLAVRKMPKSGKPQELLDFEEISKNAIVGKVKEIYASR